jgi:hypothetical protein
MPLLLCNSVVRYVIHEGRRLFPVKSQINLVHIPTPYIWFVSILSSHLHLGLRSAFLPSYLSTQTVNEIFMYYVSHISAHPTFLGVTVLLVSRNDKNVWRSSKSVHFRPTFCHLFRFRISVLSTVICKPLNLCWPWQEEKKCSALHRIVEVILRNDVVRLNKLGKCISLVISALILASFYSVLTPNCKRKLTAGS